MSEQHTPGRIRYDYEKGYCGEIIASNGTSVATFNDEPTAEDARRLAACWNACEGLHTESLERGKPLADQIVDALNQRDEVLAQRNELKHALKAILESSSNGGLGKAIHQAQDTIARVEAGAV